MTGTKSSKRRKSRRAGGSAQFSGLIGKLKNSGIMEQHEVVLQENTDSKVSEVLLNYLEPYLHVAESVEAFSRLVLLGVVSWNAALLQEWGQDDGLDRLLGEIPSSDRRDVKSLIDELMKRKRKRFREHKRLIADYHVRDTKEGYHLSVATMLNPDED